MNLDTLGPSGMQDRGQDSQDQGAKSEGAARVPVEGSEGDQNLPTPEELLLLQALLVEPTRKDAAQRLGYSERHLRRKLQSLLAKMGVANTHAAVAHAAWRGWINEEQLKVGQERDTKQLPDT